MGLNNFFLVNAMVSSVGQIVTGYYVSCLGLLLVLENGLASRFL